MARVSKRTVPQTAYFQLEPIRTPLDGGVPISVWLNAYLDWEDLSASQFTVHVAPGTRALRCRVEIHEAFTGVAGCTVGDGDTANGWIVDGTFEPSVVNSFAGDPDSTFEAAGGKWYRSGDTIDVAMSGVAGSIASAGQMILWIEAISYAEPVGGEFD